MVNRFLHREHEHFIGDEIKRTIIYLCPCVLREDGDHDASIASQVSSNVVEY